MSAKGIHEFWNQKQTDNTETYRQLLQEQK